MAEEQVRYQKNPDYLYRQVVDQAVLVPIRQEVADMDCVYTMNRLASFIWERLESEPTQAELQTAILERFAAGPEEAAADLAGFLLELEAIGAVWRA